MMDTRAYKDLQMSMEAFQKKGNLNFVKVEVVKTIANPLGDVRFAWQRIELKFAPKIKFCI